MRTSMNYAHSFFFLFSCTYHTYLSEEPHSHFSPKSAAHRNICHTDRDDRRSVGRLRRKEENIFSKVIFPDSGILPMSLHLPLPVRAPGLFARFGLCRGWAVQHRPVARLGFEGLSALLNQCRSYCKGNESPIRLFTQ